MHGDSTLFLKKKLRSSWIFAVYVHVYTCTQCIVHIVYSCIKNLVKLRDVNLFFQQAERLRSTSTNSSSVYSTSSHPPKKSSGQTKVSVVHL